jgi:hypothetical protein
MLNRLALCSLTRGLVLRTAQKCPTKRVSFGSSNHITEHLAVRPFTTSRRSAKSVAPKGVPTKNVGEASLARNDLREHLDEPAVLRLLNCTNSTHTYAYLSI